MILINEAMIPTFSKCAWEKIRLNYKLEKLLESGFIRKDGFVFFHVLSVSTRTTPFNKKHFIDKTGYECFINHLHTDDYVNEDFFAQAFLLAKKTASLWNSIDKNNHIKIIISITKEGATFRFHLIRENEFWINEYEIDQFAEPIMILTSNN